MLDADFDPENEPPESQPFPMPECDENGVDRDQIRRLLALSPAERMMLHDAFMNSIFQIWQQNGHEGFR
ncbi:MAG TPA: hypothetical protein VJN18_23430 [Polyangiaceae bacterium]|nr:hypothetical protein [Polyangiaceae bacterium]